MNAFVLAAHAASIVTAIAYLVNDVLWLRFLIVLSCIAGIIYNYAVPHPGSWALVNWNLVFLAINLAQIAVIMKERREISFTEEERELYETLFKNFAPFEFMKLLRIGVWHEAEKDDVLAVEKKQLDDVMLIYNGLVQVESDGQTLALLKDGSFIGEMSFITGGDATATVKAIEPTRYLSWSKENLRKLLNRNPSMRFAMQTVLSTDLTKKLMYRPTRTVLQT
jgi:hypothetical protein